MTPEEPETPATPEGGDPTPAGDTPQHSEEDSDRSEGRQPSQEPDEPEGGRYKRDPIGGEGEGSTTIDLGEAPKPPS